MFTIVFATVASAEVILCRKDPKAFLIHIIVYVLFQNLFIRAFRLFFILVHI